MENQCSCILKQEQYDQYFKLQSGGNLNVFSGATRQRGYGIGSLISRGLSLATPILKEGAKHVGKALLSTGANVVGNIAEDVLSGENFKSSAKSNMKLGGDTLLKNAVAYFAPKPNKKPVRKRRAPTSTKGSKRKRAEKDIFT
jgi:hypothetical protein